MLGNQISLFFWENIHLKMFMIPVFKQNLFTRRVESTIDTSNYYKFHLPPVRTLQLIGHWIFYAASASWCKGFINVRRRPFGSIVWRLVLSLTILRCILYKGYTRMMKLIGPRSNVLESRPFNSHRYIARVEMNLFSSKNQSQYFFSFTTFSHLNRSISSVKWKAKAQALPIENYYTVFPRE
jgi:hypothetical protein